MANPWDTIFKEHGRIFEHVHEDIPAVINQLEQKLAKTILDLGCGTGRHVVYCAQQGFTTYGLDSAPEAIRQTQKWLAQQKLEATLTRHDMLEPLPYADRTFDAVLSVQVIHHGRRAQIDALIAEIHRILKPGGLAFITVAKDRNQATRFEQIEPDTFVPLDGREKGLPHYFFTPDTLKGAFKQFDVQDIHIDSSNHYCLTAQTLDEQD